MNGLGPNGTLYVANLAGGDVSVIDLAALAEIRRVPVGGEGLDDVIPSSDGRLLYCSRKDLNDVVAVDSVTGELQWRCPMSGSPHHISMAPDGTELYVPIFDGGVLAVVDLLQPRVATEIPIGGGPHGTRLSEDGTILYVGTVFDGTITVIDTRKHEVMRTVQLPAGVRPFAVDSSGARLYAQQTGMHGFLVVDARSGDVEQEVPLPALPPGTEPAVHNTHDHGLCLVNGGTHIVCAAMTADTAEVYRVSDLGHVGTVPVGEEPCWAIAGAGPWAFITSRVSDTLSVIAGGDDPVEKARIPVGDTPGRMCYTAGPAG